jgi:trimeric autotransporter adhesin
MKLLMQEYASFSIVAGLSFRARTRALCCQATALLVVAMLFAVTSLRAQSGPASDTNNTTTVASASVVPRLIKFSGQINLQVKDNESGENQATLIAAAFSLYELQEGGSPLWSESQKVQLDEQGRYTVLLGATQAEGLPLDLFTSGKALWLGVQPQLPGAVEQPRVLLVAVPYALKAADADTLGGKPASTYVTTDMQTAASPSSQSNGGVPPSGPGSSGQSSGPGKPLATKGLSPASPGGSGTANYVPIWTNSTTLGNSILFQAGGKVGVGTSTPAARLDVPGNGRDILIGDAGCGTGYGGIGFGALSKCINYSLLGDGTNTFLNRSKGGTLYFREGNATEMVITSSGRVGIGTTNPLANLHVLGSSVLGATITDALQASSGQFLGAVQIGPQNLGFSMLESDALDGSGLDGGAFVGATDSDSYTFAGSGLTAYGGQDVSSVGSNGGEGGAFFGGDSTNADGGNGIFAAAGNLISAGGVPGLAGYFYGDLDVSGAITAGTKDFKIDHPLDPANKYLYHASVESSEMKNIYDGTVITDSHGDAVVQLPEWFEALNRDFRYQLTVIGQFAQAIVASKIANHQFAIKTDKPNVEVSWQVTGVRQDAYAKAHPLEVGVAKSERERGYYLYPELYGAPEEKQIEWAHRPQMMKQMKQRRAKQQPTTRETQGTGS